MKHVTNEKSNSATEVEEFHFSLVIYDTISRQRRSEHVSKLRIIWFLWQNPERRHLVALSINLY